MEQPRGLFKGSICNFYVSKVCKKRVHRNEKMNLPCAFKKCPGSLHITLLLEGRPMPECFMVNWLFDIVVESFGSYETIRCFGCLQFVNSFV